MLLLSVLPWIATSLWANGGSVEESFDLMETESPQLPSSPIPLSLSVSLFCFQSPIDVALTDINDNRLVPSEASAFAIILGILHLDGNWSAAIESIQLIAASFLCTERLLELIASVLFNCLNCLFYSCFLNCFLL
jgi:hypothetical protein